MSLSDRNRKTHGESDEMIGRLNSAQYGKSFRAVARAWFKFTPQERMWVCLVMSLIFLGLMARCFRMRGEREQERPRSTPMENSTSFTDR